MTAPPAAVGVLALFLALFLAMATAATLGTQAPARAAAGQPVAPDDRVRVVMTELEPFVEDRDGRPSGFYAEIWQVVATELGVEVDVIWVDRFGDLLTSLDDDRADVAVAPLTPTVERVAGYDFTSSVVSSGPQLGYHQRLATSKGVFDALFSRSVRQILLLAGAGLLILAHLIWLIERNRSDEEDGDFRPDYFRGIWDGFWWATVTVTTVGYGDKAPRSFGGRAVALLAMLLSLFLVGAFVSQVTDILQSARNEPPVTDLDDVGDRAVGVVEDSSFARYVADQGVTIVGYPNQAELFEAAERGDVDLVVSNPFALATAGIEHDIQPAGEVFYTEFESFALAKDSPWLEPINQVLAGLQSSGEVDEIVDRWVGSD